jgi:hypothetical protein
MMMSAVDVSPPRRFCLQLGGDEQSDPAQTRVWFYVVDRQLSGRRIE